MNLLDRADGRRSMRHWRSIHDPVLNGIPRSRLVAMTAMRCIAFPFAVASSASQSFLP